MTIENMYSWDVQLSKQSKNVDIGLLLDQTQKSL